MTDYANSKNWKIYKVYIDEDWSGSERNRPDFNQMISDAEAGKFDIILCKKQSRFCRDSQLAEYYFHEKFIMWGIRFISIVDHTDTDDKANKKARQINALIDEWYLEDISNDIKSVFQNKRLHGEYIGAYAPYGYLKDPENKNHLVIDEAVADNIKLIYNLYEKRIWRNENS